jgi:hypothetical protein
VGERCCLPNNSLEKPKGNNKSYNDFVHTPEAYGCPGQKIHFGWFQNGCICVKNLQIVWIRLYPG